MSHAVTANAFAIARIFPDVRFDASGIDPATQDFELVLATCWPFDAVTSGPERYLLHATLIGDGE